MEWILNDLSLKNKYTESRDFFADIEEILKLRASNKLFSDNFLCPRNIGGIEILHDKIFSQIVLTEAPKELKQQIMSWVNKKGPFWCDRRTDNEDDYFEFNNIDVTDLGLGECARKLIISQPVASYSFSGPYDSSPLPVQHGLTEDILGTYRIDNFWTNEQLLDSCRASVPVPTNWKEALERLSERFENLIFSTVLLEQISILPYNKTVYDRMQELCRVLEEFLASRDEFGNGTEHTDSILNEFFRGRKAWFSDETDRDKEDFKNQLKFLDNRDDTKKQYSFHGKIKTPQVRVYFEWPILPEQKDIQIVYFGPKITKR